MSGQINGQNPIHRFTTLTRPKRHIKSTLKLFCCLTIPLFFFQQFWRGKPAIDFDKFQIDCSKYDMSKVIAKDAQGQWKHLSNNKVVEALKVGFD